MSQEEKRRRVERIGRDRLPASLLSMIMVFDTGDEFPVETFDASTLGLGLSVPLPEAILKAHPGILLKAHNGEFQLIGEIVFVIATGYDSCRVGVQFTQTIAIESYLKLLP